MTIRFNKYTQNTNTSISTPSSHSGSQANGSGYLKDTLAVPKSALGRSRDLAGNNKRSAREIGALTDTQTYRFRDRIGKSDPNDYYAFTVGTRSNFKAVLSGLGANSNFKLLSANGANLFRDGSQLSEPNRSIGYTRILGPGTYYLQVNQTAGKSHYNLQLNPVSLSGNIENKGLSFLQDYPDLSYENGANFYRYTKDGRTDAGIDPNKKTVVVIHGRGDSSEGSQIKDLSETTAKVYENQGYQVLALDWKEPANDALPIPFTAARAVTPVAEWATRTLENLGLTKNRITIFGHSLGAYVSAEVSREFGGVKQLVALDPAFPAQQYDLNGNEPNDQKASGFAAVAKQSLAFAVQDSSFSLDSIAGDNDQASTATNSLLIDYDGAPNLGPTKAHITVIDVFSNALSNQFLKLNDDLALPPHLNDVYNNSGKLVQSNGSHEGRVLATRNGKVEKLVYVDRKTAKDLNQAEAWKDKIA